MFSKPSFVLLGTLVALGALDACSTDHGGDGNDAGIVVPDSARPPDAVFYDAGPVSGNVGNACTADTDCTGAATMCLNGDPTFFPNGYCSATCDTTVADSCPMGSQCQDFGGGQMFCLLICDPSVMTRQCNGRMGYGCANSLQVSGVCLGGCVDATDCGGTLMCDQTGGQLGTGACFTPGAAAGIACTMDTQCPMGGLCQPENGGGWPGGSCIVPGCDATANTGCDTGAQCIALQTLFGPPSGYCLEGCDPAAPACRTGYACTASPVNPDRHYCAPACTTDAQCSGGRVCNVGLGTCNDPFTGTIGGTCSRRDPTTCAGGTCFSERSSGFPATYCTYAGCGPSEPCPGTSVCAPRPGNTSVCLASCTSDTDCHTTGYHCRPSDPANPTSATACVPSCTTNTDCTSMSMAGMDQCNVGTGLCTSVFTPTTQLGMPCTSDSACVGGRCMTEASFGYAGGECVLPGCSLTTGVTGAVCPTASTCVDDGIGSPDFGLCAPTCTLGATSCRAGYACTAIPGGTTTGACTPACAVDTDCTPGRTCNATTGLCH